jgi:hypothetical protein
MKLIIDIPDEEYKTLSKMSEKEKVNELSYYERAIANGIPYEERPQGKCKTCIHRDPEDKKCDCGELERQGCPFPVTDDYFCKFYDKGGAK